MPVTLGNLVFSLKRDRVADDHVSFWGESPEQPVGLVISSQADLDLGCPERILVSVRRPGPVKVDAGR